jgi:hypothetical protein
MKQIDHFLVNGFAIVENIYTPKEVELILELISQTNSNKLNFRMSVELFAIRQF